MTFSADDRANRGLRESATFDRTTIAAMPGQDDHRRRCGLSEQRRQQGEGIGVRESEVGHHDLRLRALCDAQRLVTGARFEHQKAERT